MVASMNEEDTKQMGQYRSDFGKLFVFVCLLDKLSKCKTSLVMPLMQGGKPRTIKLSYSLMGRLSRSDKEPAFQFF